MRRPLSWRFKLLAGAGALTLGAGSFVAYQITNRGAPSFRRGGEFATVSEAGATTTATSALSAPGSGPAGAASEVTGPGSSTAASATSTLTTRATPGRGTNAAAVPAGSTSTTATRAVGVPLTASTAQAGVSPSTTPASPAVTTATAGPAATPGPPVSGTASLRQPRVGTYTYAVDGEEDVTLIGSRRLPDQMTTVVHGAEGLGPDELVFDLRYSDEHEEREIVRFDDDGISFGFEAGSISFGPRTQTEEADYDPPLLQIPQPLQAGVVRTGTSQAKSADGSVKRTEDWKVVVSGREQIVVAGAAIDTWKVIANRKSKPGGSDTVDRTRTYWFDPARAIWVKFIEDFRGERKSAGFSFSYKAHITATLMNFSPPATG